MKKLPLFLGLGIIILSACQPGTQPEKALPATQFASKTPVPAISATASLTSTPQPREGSADYGPELESFPFAFNPLTGLPVQDPSMLELPAVLVSISNMPVTARPQAGLSFASWVFEFFIGEGTTRFMSVFYGDYPRIIPDVKGTCPVREERILPEGVWIGDRVWLDENADGQADAWEAGVGGICVLLYRNGDYEHFWGTSTDSNGYYAIPQPKDEAGNPLAGDYELRFEIPATYTFTTPNIGDDDHDSDVDPTSAQTTVFRSSTSDSSWDAGLLLLAEPAATPNPVVTGTPPGWYIPTAPYVGPIRSGRLTYNHIKSMFTDSCLVFASAGRGILEALDVCEIIFGVDRYDPNSALLTVEHMRELAEESRITNHPINYSGNLFSETLPQGGQPGTDLWVYYHDYSQSSWQYDHISKSYVRFTDVADGTSTFVPATDRLTGRQLAFENIIVLPAEHDRVRHLQYDIDLSIGKKEPAYLFRDGQIFLIYWSTISREWEQSSGYLRPIYFIDAQGNSVPLRHGHTWIHLVTPESTLVDLGNGHWQVQFVQLYDPPDTPEP